MIYFGLDLGTNSLGISINNELNIVFGVENYNFSKGNYKKARTHLLQLMKKRSVYNLVIGLPLQLDGSEGERANSVRRFISDLKKEADFEFDVCFFDERYSTIEENTTYDEWLKNNPIIGSTSKTSVFSNYIYTNYVQNKINGTNVNDKNVVLKSDYIIKYEDIIVNDDNQKTYLSSSDSLSSVINKIKVTKQTASAMSETTSSLSSTSDLVGACLYPNLLSKSQVMTDGGEYGAKYIETGGSLSIPIVYEYYVESTLPKITKSIYFDLRNSLISDPIHYMIEITGNYDYTTTGEIYKDIDNAIQTNTIL